VTADPAEELTPLLDLMKDAVERPPRWTYRIILKEEPTVADLAWFDSLVADVRTMFVIDASIVAVWSESAVGKLFVLVCRAKRGGSTVVFLEPVSSESQERLASFGLRF
jgi:hypothetical protein